MPGSAADFCGTYLTTAALDFASHDTTLPQTSERPWQPKVPRPSDFEPPAPTPGAGSTTTWKSRMGSERGVRWRGGAPPTPPAWRYDAQDPRAYSKYAKKVALWRIQAASYMTPCEASLMLYNSLSGEAETELEHAQR